MMKEAADRGALEETLTEELAEPRNRNIQLRDTNRAFLSNISA